VLQKSEKKKYRKNQNTKKNDKSNTINVQYWHGEYNKVAVILQNLSQLIGALFLCDSSAYVEIRSSIFNGLNFRFQFALSSSR